MGSWVHLGSLGSFGYNLGVVWFSRGCCFPLGALLGSLCSFGDDWSIRVRSGGRWFHLGSLIRVRPGVVGFIPGCWVVSSVFSGSSGSFWCALSVIGYLRCRCIHSGVPWFIPVRRVHSGVPWFASGAHWGSLRSFSVYSCVHSGVPSGSSGSFECALGVIGYLHYRLG